MQQMIAFDIIFQLAYIYIYIYFVHVVSSEFYSEKYFTPVFTILHPLSYKRALFLEFRFYIFYQKGYLLYLTYILFILIEKK